MELFPDVVGAAADPDPLVRFEIGLSANAVFKRVSQRLDEQRDGRTDDKWMADFLKFRRLAGFTKEGYAPEIFYLAEYYAEFRFVSSRSDSEVRSFLARCIPKIYPESADPDCVPFFGLCGNRDVNPPQRAIEWLVELRPHLGAPLIRDLMNHHPEQASTSLYLHTDLDGIGDQEWRAWLTSPWPQVRQVALNQVGREKDRKAWPQLLKLTGHASVSTRIFALMAMFEIDASRTYGTYVNYLDRAEGEEFESAWSLGRRYLEMDALRKRYLIGGRPSQRDYLLSESR